MLLGLGRGPPGRGPPGRPASPGPPGPGLPIGRGPCGRGPPVEPGAPGLPAAWPGAPRPGLAAPAGPAVPGWPGRGPRGADPMPEPVGLNGLLPGRGPGRGAPGLGPGAAPLAARAWSGQAPAWPGRHRRPHRQRLSPVAVPGSGCENGTCGTPEVPARPSAGSCVLGGPAARSPWPTGCPAPGGAAAAGRARSASCSDRLGLARQAQRPVLPPRRHGRSRPACRRRRMPGLLMPWRSRPGRRTPP